MRGKIVKIEKKSFEVKQGENKGIKFDKIVFEVDVVVNEQTGEIKRYKGDMNVNYARKYFAYCKTSTAEQIGNYCEVVVAKRMYKSNDQEKTIKFIKYLNLLDQDGKAIIMPSDDSSKCDF